MILRYHDGERQVVRVRKHWFAVTLRLVEILAVYLSVLAGGFFLVDRIFVMFTDRLALFVFFAGLLGVLAWSLAFNAWLNYHLDVWVVTTKRVFDIEQVSLFSRNVSGFRLNKVQDITVEVHGFVRTLLDFGTIHVQTAARSREFLITDVPHPAAVADIISREVEHAAGRSKDAQYDV